jgi:hypothetical protein
MLAMEPASGLAQVVLYEADLMVLYATPADLVLPPASRGCEHRAVRFIDKQETGF